MTKKKRNKSSKKKISDDSIKRRKTALLNACQRKFPSEVVKLEYPAGRSRESWRVVFDNGQSLIATRRSTSKRAAIEANTLRALNKHAAPVPVLLNTDGDRILFQEELNGQRLSLALNSANETTAEALLDSALSGLTQSQLAGSQESIEKKLPHLGNKTSWITSLVKRPIVIGDYFDLPAPDYDINALVDMLHITEPRFVKWDSRPGNALVNDKGIVHWFDWEHAGVRNRLDDLAWLLCDEFVPDMPVLEKKLLQRFLPQFSDLRNPDQAMDYVMAYGTFHTLIRLGLILKYKVGGDWWDLNYCIDRDKIGITLNCAQRLCARGARWANQVSATQPLTPWFTALSTRIAAL